MKKKIIISLIVTIIIILAHSYIDMKTIYLDSNTKIYSFGNMIIKSNNNKRIILKKVYVYSNGRKRKGYLKSNKGDSQNEYYAVSINNRTINTDSLVASGMLSKINVYDIENSINEIDESLLLEVNELLDSDISIDSIMGYKKVELDIDNDANNEEVIYLLYNDNSSLITKLFVVDDNSTINIIDYEIDFEKSTVGNSYYLSNIIDLNGDGKYEIIVSKASGDSSPIYNDIYRIDNGEKKEIK